MLRVDTWSSVGFAREQPIKLNSAHHLSDVELGSRVKQDIKKLLGRRQLRLRSVTRSELGETDTVGRVARSKELKGHNDNASLQNNSNPIDSHESTGIRENSQRGSDEGTGIATGVPKPIGGDKRRVMCLMSDTGGGHRASAQALKDCFEIVYGDTFSVDIVDLWSSYSPWPFCEMPKSYFFLVKNPWLWRLNFRCSEPRFIHEVMFKGYTAIVAKRFTRAFVETDPHLVVSVHPLMQHVPLNVLDQMKRQSLISRLPFATVVTDLTRCHTTWFHKSVDKCFVATKLVASQALRLGLQAEQIVCHGLPIRPSFSAPKQFSKQDIRARLGLHEDAPTVMLVGGGEGMGKLKEIAEALGQTLRHTHQVIVVCGRNTRLSDFLKGQAWPFKMVVKGFINNMAEYMSACNCVISKAGPGTIAEAMICGVPIILNGCIPCQEEGNIPYVIDNQVGAYSESPSIIAQIVADWLAPENLLQLRQMSSRAHSLGRPQATYDIVCDLADTERDETNAVCFAFTPIALTEAS